MVSTLPSNDVARLFTPAYLKSATANDAIKRFQSPGIWLINMDIWEDKDYAPSSTTMMKPNTANTKAAFHETTNRDVLTATVDHGAVPTTSGFQCSFGPNKASEIYDHDFSDEEVEPAGPICVTVQIHTSTMRETNDSALESVFCPGISEPGGVSPTIIPEVNQEDPFKISKSPARYFTSDIQHTSGSKDDLLISEEIYDQTRSRSCTPNVTDDHVIPAANKAEISATDLMSTSTLLSNKKPAIYQTSPAAYLSPREIRPLPSPFVPMGTRKRYIQRSEVLTSTPVKGEQKIKFVKANTKALKNMNKNLKRKTRPKKKTNITKNIEARNTKLKKFKLKKMTKTARAIFVGKIMLKLMGSQLMIGSNAVPARNGATRNAQHMRERAFFFVITVLISD
ncbi:unnamed protein product [Diatraea saccharalis]|uniref:Uncharacterized protein n=1 Tax=Diatraea saccharalis TaxID=40085 RepID=A0A9N9WKA4_9NEOP|nr:unnamed protein product [Diatraea saccharalis]